MWNPFKKKEPEVIFVAPTSYEFVPEGAIKKPKRDDNWRQGMWVVCDMTPAILHKLYEYSGEVHYVDPETGQTVMEKIVALNELRQATWSEIPSVRRQFDREVARGLGYGD